MSALGKAGNGVCKAYIQIADYGNKKKIVDQELAKLRQLDAALADELEKYRKAYIGGIIGTPVNVDK